MKARKILCMALSLMLILTSFPFVVSANVTGLEAQPALLEIDFDDYTESFISSASASKSFMIFFAYPFLRKEGFV